MVGASGDDSAAIVLGGVDGDLDRLLADLLRHLAAAGGEQVRRLRCRRVLAPSFEDRFVQTSHRIAHPASLPWPMMNDFLR